MGDNKEVKKDKASLVSALWGIIGSTWGKIVSHPIDTIKARLQVIPGSTFNLEKGSVIINSGREILKNDGVKGFYKGLPTAIVGGIPGAFLYFGAYEYWKKKTLEYDFFQRHSFISYLSAGMFAETIAWLVFVPTDVLKERLQVQSKLNTYNYKSDANAFVQIIKGEGVRGLYKAYPATVFSFGPFSALYFLFYENIKGVFVSNDANTYLDKVKSSSHVQIGFFQSMLSSMIAGAAAGFLTNPLDLVKLRLQVQRGSKAATGKTTEGFQYRHMVDGLIQVVSKEGYLALWNGSMARIWTNIPTVAIAMSIIEFTKPHMEKFIN